MLYINLRTGQARDIIAPPNPLRHGGCAPRVVERISSAAPDIVGGRRVVVDRRDWPFPGNVSLFGEWRQFGLRGWPFTGAERLPIGTGLLAVSVRGEMEVAPCLPRYRVLLDGLPPYADATETVRAPDDGLPHCAVGVAPTEDGARQLWAALEQPQETLPRGPWAAYTSRPCLPPALECDVIQFGAAFAWAVMQRAGPPGR